MRLDRNRQGQGLRCRRAGSVVAELILVFPILVGFFLGTIEFSLLLHARQQLLAASREGARVGARGGNNSEITAAVKQALGAPSALADNAVISITPVPAVVPNSRNQITVCVQVADGKAAPNLIPFLIDMKNEQLLACPTMKVE